MSTETAPREALATYIRELENDYLKWYDSASMRLKYAWGALQLTSIVGSAAATVLAALAKDGTEFVSIRWWLIGLPAAASLAPTRLVQTRTRDLRFLRARSGSHQRERRDLGRAARGA